MSWRSKIELSPGFFEILVNRPVPVDLRVASALRSPLAFDVYVWLTYRMSYLRRPTEIPWSALASRFGAEYARVRDFKRAFPAPRPLRHDGLSSSSDDSSGALVLLQPSPPHVSKSRYI